jgi:hypothetical protein
VTASLAIELGIDQDDVVSPWHAAMASAVAFFTGALLPMATSADDRAAARRAADPRREVAGDGERQQHRHECGHDPGRMRQQEDRRHRQQRTGEPSPRS